MNQEPCTERRAPVNYVFVDLENMPNVDLSCIGAKAVHVTLLLGAQQTKVDVTLTEKLLAHAASVQLARLESNRKNALDFTLAYYLGRAVQADPNAYFHIVSKDTGYEPLIAHLKSRHISIHRHADASTLTFGPPSKPEKTVKAVTKPAKG